MEAVTCWPDPDRPGQPREEDEEEASESACSHATVSHRRRTLAPLGWKEEEGKANKAASADVPPDRRHLARPGSRFDKSLSPGGRELQVSCVSIQFIIIVGRLSLEVALPLATGDAV